MRIKHKAVSPIISTLLLIGTGVTGGTTILFLAPTYFNEDLLVEEPFDELEVFGYSARDQSGIINNHLNSNLTCASASDSGDLTDGDCITVFVVNRGSKPTIVQNVIVFDKTYGFSSTGASASTCQTSSDSFSVHTNNDMNQGIDPNEEATICIKYSDKTLKIGRNIPVQIETGNGQELELKIINGDMRG
jgi:hypothetical protein